MNSKHYINAPFRHEIYQAALRIFNAEVQNGFHPCLCGVLKKAVIELNAECLIQMPDNELIYFFDELITCKPEGVHMLWFPLEEIDVRKKLLEDAIINSSYNHVKKKLVS